MTNRAGWILTGGRSSRMGFDKALALVEGRALALRVADVIAPVCGSVRLVGDPARYAGLGLPVTEDEFPGCGPLAGIEAALRSTGADRNLIVACDMPRVSAAVIEELFAAGGDCAVPRHANGNLEPLCAVWETRCHSVIRAAFEAGTRSVIDALRTVELRYVQVANEEQFANLNTPEDLQRFQRFQKHRHG